MGHLLSFERQQIICRNVLFFFCYLRPGSSHGRGARRECRDDVCERVLGSAGRGVGAVTRVP